MRGHRDCGPFYSNKEIIQENEATENANNEATGDEKESIMTRNDGNCRALLRFRIEAGDTVLKNHMNSAKSNATYISKNTQNELINACKEEIQKNYFRQSEKSPTFFCYF